MVDHPLGISPARCCRARWLKRFSHKSLAANSQPPVAHRSLVGGYRFCASALLSSNISHQRSRLGYTACPRTESFRGIIELAGESDDRRCILRKRNTREESPDSHSPQLARVSDYRATRLVTPGGCVSQFAQASHDSRLRKVPQKIKPPVTLAPRRQAYGKPQSCLFRRSAFGKGEKGGVRAHRPDGNIRGTENPAWSKAK